MGERTGAAAGVLASALHNPPLRRIALSYGLFTGAEWGVWIALLVYAYDRGGTSASSLIAITQLVPCALLGPLIGVMADRNRPGRVLVVGYAVQCATMAGVAIAIATGAPTWTVFVLAPLVNIGITVTRPARPRSSRRSSAPPTSSRRRTSCRDGWNRPAGSSSRS